MKHVDGESLPFENFLVENDLCLAQQKARLAGNLDFPRLLTEDVDLLLGSFTYPCRFRRNAEARYLSVQLHGTAPRGTGSSLPVFARWNWGKILGAHVLSICDPTIYQDETLSIGWYLGNRYETVIHGIVAIAQGCAELLGIAEDRIIFSGSSGGGFAALQAAAVAKEGRALAINAQTNLAHYVKSLVNNYVEKASGCASVAEAEEVFAQRWNAIHSLQAAIMRGKTPKVVFVQNRNDWHYQQHFTPFAEAFALSLQEDQSRNRQFMAILYDGPHGHEPEPAEVVKLINSDGLPFLLNGEFDAASQPHFTIRIRQEAGQLLTEIDAVSGAGDPSYQFACYLLKNGAPVEKKFYTRENKFSFNLCGRGQYKCMGYVRDGAELIFTGLSAELEVK